MHIFPKRTLEMVFLLSLALPGPAYAQWRGDEAAALRAENRKLQSKIDSLTALVNRYTAAATMDLWASLEGIELDGDDIFFDATNPGKPRMSRDDAELMDKIRRAAPSICVPFRSEVREFVDFYTIKKRRHMRTVIARYERYLPTFERYFKPLGIPEEITALCIVESAVSPRAKSPVGAYGMWQLMPATARQYGIQVNDLQDDRTDVELSTAVAAKILASAYKRYGRWDFAVCSYNCGIGGVNRAIIKSGGSGDFWAVYDFLPKETKGYLLSLLAVRYSMVYAKELNI